MRIQNTLTLTSYADRAKEATAIKNEFARAEQGKPVDLNQTAAKLDILREAWKKDSVAIGKLPLTQKLREAHLSHGKELFALDAKIKVLSLKANNVPSWVKLTAYTALGVTAVAGAYLAATKLGMFPSTTPTPSNPTPAQTPIRPWRTDFQIANSSSKLKGPIIEPVVKPQCWPTFAGFDFLQIAYTKLHMVDLQKIEPALKSSNLGRAASFAT